MKKLATLMAFLLIFLCIPAFAEPGTNNIKVTTTVTDGYTLTKNTAHNYTELTITKGGTYEIAADDPDSPIPCSILISAKDEDVTLILAGVNFDMQASDLTREDTYEAIDVSYWEKPTSVTLTLKQGTINILKGNGGGAAISNSSVPMTINGTGTLYAYGSTGTIPRVSYGGGGYSYGAAIGGSGSSSTAAQNITIESGTIYAYGSGRPGIGSGRSWVAGSYGGAASDSIGVTSKIYISPVNGASIYAETRSSATASDISKSGTFTEKELICGDSARINLCADNYFYCTTTMPEPEEPLIPGDSNQAAPLPQTGDETPLLLYISMILLAGAFLTRRKLHINR